MIKLPFVNCLSLLACILMMCCVLCEANKLLETGNMTYQFTWQAWGSHWSYFSSTALEKHNAGVCWTACQHSNLNHYANRTISYQGFC